MAADELGASSKAIRHHYDAGNDFYRLWLDETMTYSGALYERDDESLETAQLRKIDFHVAQARAADAQRVLDVGCGWGSVLRRLVETHGVGHAVGLTLSQAQADWVAKRSDPRIEVRVESWADHEPAEPYDAIISLGAMEHFAKPEISVEEKIQAYRTFFERCHAWLVPGGRVSFQAIAYGNLKREDFAGSFVARDIFPESEFVRLSEVAEAAERLFEIERVRNDCKDYERTCRVWLENLRRDREAAVAAAGKDLVERYDRYLELCVRGWQLHATNLLRVGMRRIDHPRV
ncbi:MAG: class I SAM-dependent methyltransferase [Myxococcales bacterium]|nr:class I SAM-dependent methyltransferase [Myxococcales bacterium]